MKREEFGGLLEEREDILFTSEQTLFKAARFHSCTCERQRANN